MSMIAEMNIECMEDMGISENKHPLVKYTQVFQDMIESEWPFLY